jgi:uncharacterized protein YkwD
VALVLLDEGVELAPVPRQLPAGGKATLSGKLPPGAVNPKVYACDPSGKFEAPKQAGEAVAAEVACGDKPGQLLVDIRAEVKGASQSLARLAIACGEAKDPASIPVVAPQKGALDGASAGRKLFELGNAERAQAGLPPLSWDDEVATAARAAAEAYRAEADGGGAAVDAEKALQAAGVSTLLVLQNPVAALSLEEAAAVTAQSPVNRCNLLNREVTAGGVGVATTSDANGNTIVYATELFVRELPPVDAPALRASLRQAIAERREASRAAPLAADPVLEEVAQKYAELLAAKRGAPGKAEEGAVVAPLYKAFRTVNIMSGVKPDALELAQEPGMIAPGKALGVGVASGTHAVLGKNAPYVVVVVGTPQEKRPAAEAAPAGDAAAEKPAPAAGPAKKGKKR